MASISYVEEVIVRYLQKKGYLVSQNIWFKRPQKANTGSGRHSGYSDVDILAIKPGEVLIVQAATDASTKKKPSQWFDEAISAMRESELYSSWMKGSTVKKVLVFDYYPKTTGFADTMAKEGIIFWSLPDILKELIELLSEEMRERRERSGGRYGKQSDPLIRILMRLITLGLLSSGKKEE